jgi:hypothetical protein
LLAWKVSFSRRGTCTLPAGRVSFQSTRYMAGWKETLPAGELHVLRMTGGQTAQSSRLKNQWHLGSENLVMVLIH